MEPIFITKKEELERILNSEICFLFPVLKNPKEHYCRNTLSFVYGFTRNSRIEFLIGVEHYDVPKLECDIGLLRTNLQHISYKKKYLPVHEVLLDADLLKWLNSGEMLKIKSNPCIDFFQRNGKDNSIVPIFKWIELIRKIRDEVLELQMPPAPVMDSYNNLLNQLIKVEHAGLHCNFHCSDIGERNGNGKCVEYTEYNPYTLTGRPSNKFGGINYAALNKTDGSRERFISRFKDGYLVEFDYQAFHINLIAKILKYSFPEQDPYPYLATEFFNTPEPTDEQIHASKELTFQQVYGGVRSEYKHIRFFKLLDDFLTKIELENKNGTVKSFLFKKPIKSTENYIKTFNYLLQNLETEINSLVLTKLNEFLKNKETKVILYTYDSFLFDYSPNDGRDILREIKQILGSIGIPSRIKIGKNYHTMIQKH